MVIVVLEDFFDHQFGLRAIKRSDGSLAIFHGPQKLADYDAVGMLKNKKKEGSVGPPPYLL